MGINDVLCICVGTMEDRPDAASEIEVRWNHADRGPAPVTERLRLREIDDDEGRRLVRIIRRGSGSVVTWRRAQR